MDKKYILYDMRALEDTDEAAVFYVGDSLKEVKKEAKNYGGGVIYSYDVRGRELLNEKLEEIING